MSTHNICFHGEMSKIILELSSDTLLICSTVWNLFQIVILGDLISTDNNLRRLLPFLEIVIISTFRFNGRNSMLFIQNMRG